MNYKFLYHPRNMYWARVGFGSSRSQQSPIRFGWGGPFSTSPWLIQTSCGTGPIAAPLGMGQFGKCEGETSLDVPFLTITKDNKTKSKKRKGKIEKDEVGRMMILEGDQKNKRKRRNNSWDCRIWRGKVSEG